MDAGAQTALGQSGTQRRGLPPIGVIVEIARRDAGAALVGSVLPFALVVYLALRGGGYDRVVHGEVGIAIWWLLLLGALAGVLPTSRISRAGWIALGLLAIFVAWTTLGITWSESAERSAADAGRVAAYLGIFALALAAQGRDGLRRTANAVAVAIALVGVLALLSRLHPAWFPANDGARLLPSEIGNRLSYPLNYWNGLAALMAMGVPLLLVVALRARHLATQALAAAALPVLVLTAFYTFSRGGALAIGVAAAAFLAMYPRRLAASPTMLVSGIGAALLIAAASQRGALENRVLTEGARTQGDEMLAMVLLVCAGVAMVQIAIALAVRHGLRPRPRVSPRHGAVLAAGAVIAALVVALAAGLPGDLADRWSSDTPAVRSVGSDRLENLNADNRTQYWDSALDASATSPLTGIGSGTFEFWWARNGGGGFIRDAHSLYIETLAELGIIGLVLILSVIGTVIFIGMSRVMRSGPDSRMTLAGLVAACIAFSATAAFDWVWELPVLPVTFLLIASAILGAAPAASRGAPPAVRDSQPSPPVRRKERVGLVALAILALIAIAAPLLSTEFARESQGQLRSGERDSALRSADAARTVEPFAATASTQRALVLEELGQPAHAAEAAHKATRDERTNWRTWLLLAGVEAERGRESEAVDAYERAYQLNPHSRTFIETSPATFASSLKP